MADTEQLYRDGVARWAARDLDGAVDLIAAAVAASPGPDADNWWFAATRALAQIALERDDPDVAAFNLARLPGTVIGDAQTLALRARLALLRGDEREAQEHLGGAVLRVLHDRGPDIGLLMNGAIALASCAEVLVELGYGDDATRVVWHAQERIARAGIHDEVLTRWLALDAAGAARLRGDTELALAELANVEADAGDDYGVRIARERARLAWDAGDRAGADRWYEQAIAEAVAQRHAALARLVAAERTAGPPALRTAPLPVERWTELAMGGLDLPDAPADEPLPYAVVVTLVVDEDVERYLDLDDRVCALLDAQPELGEVDGIGTDGVVWELFVDGDDPEALWEAIRPHVEAVNPPRGSQATIRHDDGTWRIEPLAPPL